MLNRLVVVIPDKHYCFAPKSLAAPTVDIFILDTDVQTGWRSSSYQERKLVPPLSKKWLNMMMETHCFPWGSFSCNFSSTFTSSLAASLYLSTFLMIFNARTWSLKKRNYQGIVWKISGVVFLHRVVSDLVTLNLTRMAIWKRNIFV